MKRVGVILVLLIVPIVGIFGRRVYQDYSRPLFHNVYGHNDRIPLSWWRWQSPLIDNAGRVGIADYKLNLFVVVVPVVSPLAGEAAREKGMSVWRMLVFNATRDGTRVNLTTNGDEEVMIPRMENALVIVLPDGRISRFALSQGQAKWFFENLSRASHDLLAALEDLCEPEAGGLRQFLREQRERLQGNAATE